MAKIMRKYRITHLSNIYEFTSKSQLGSFQRHRSLTVLDSTNKPNFSTFCVVLRPIGLGDG